MLKTNRGKVTEIPVAKPLPYVEVHEVQIATAPNKALTSTYLLFGCGHFVFSPTQPFIDCQGSVGWPSRGNRCDFVL